MVGCAWWDCSLRTLSSFSALTLLVRLFDPNKPVPHVMYNVFGGMLNLSQSITDNINFLTVFAELGPNSTTRTRPDFVGDLCLRPGLQQSSVGSARVSDKSADFVWSWTCPFNLDMYGFCPCVWSGRRQSPWVRVVEFRNDTTRPDQRTL